jgi:hypothetical protein
MKGGLCWVLGPDVFEGLNSWSLKDNIKPGIVLCVVKPGSSSAGGFSSAIGGQAMQSSAVSSHHK